MARTQAQDKYDAANYVFQSIKVRPQLLDDFKAACAARGDKVNAVLRVAMEQYVKESAAVDVAGDARGVVLTLDDVITVCAILDSLVLGDTRADRIIAETRDKLDHIRDAAIEHGSEQRKNSE